MTLVPPFHTKEQEGPMSVLTTEKDSTTLHCSCGVCTYCCGAGKYRSDLSASLPAEKAPEPVTRSAGKSVDWPQNWAAHGVGIP